jgi:hypothetical protein
VENHNGSKQHPAGTMNQACRINAAKKQDQALGQLERMELLGKPCNDKKDEHGSIHPVLDDSYPRQALHIGHFLFGHGSHPF